MQLPPSCISRATVIAAKLEAEVSSRVQNRSAKRDLLVKLSDQEQEAQENMPVSPESFYLGRVEASEDLISAYRDLFLNLKFATHDDNPAKSFQFLKHARSIAKELIIRYGVYDKYYLFFSSSVIQFCFCSFHSLSSILFLLNVFEV